MPRGFAGVVIALVAMTPAAAQDRRMPVAGAAAVPSGLVGEYTHSEMELAAGISLKADGTFEYGLTVGALDERATGRWTATGDRIALVNEPRPVPPTLTAGPSGQDPRERFSLKVVTPSGEGIAGVDLAVGFDTGEPIEGYTQTYGWALPAGEVRAPRWVMLSMESYGLRSPRFPVDAARANAPTFILTPNDIGVVDLTGVKVTNDRDGLTIEREGHAMHFDRQGRGQGRP